MVFQASEPLLVVGLGGAGARLAPKAAGRLGAGCLLISNDSRDLGGKRSIHVDTGAIINPSIQLVRGSAYASLGAIRDAVSGHRTVVMVANLAGRAGAAVAPVVAQACREAGAGLVSFAIMPFGYEKSRIFSSGVALKRVREGPGCTIVVDNDSLLKSNPDLSTKECYMVAEAAMMHVAGSLGSGVPGDTSILSAGRRGTGMEESLRDALKMLYGNAPPGSIRHSVLYVAGGGDVPVGVLESVSDLAGGITGGSDTRVDMEQEESGIVMLSATEGMTKFEVYDPLGMIPAEDSLDWSVPDCSIDCDLGLRQIE